MSEASVADDALNEPDSSGELGPVGAFDPTQEFRSLYHDLLAYDGAELYAEFLVPWLARHAPERDWLRDFAQRHGAPIPAAHKWELHALYALSRVNDLMLGAFQPAVVREWPVLPLTLEHYVAFMTALGLEVEEAAAFSPFYHEVLELAPQAHDAAPVELTGTAWPCLMLGPMLFSRAGARVRAGRRLLRPELASSTTLYWSFCRRYRLSHDLSQGWGGNSQWRTDFRRDYRIGTELYLNVDVKRDVSQGRVPGHPPCELTLEERRELVLHRCFVTQTGRHEDLFPYAFSMRLSEAG